MQDRHGRRGLILGAGFSYDLGMPLASELTELFLGLFNDGIARKLVKLMSLNEPFTKDRPINESALQEGMQLVLAYKRRGGTNYEEVLSELELLGNTGGKSQSDRDSYHYLFSVFYSVLHQMLVAYQSASYDTMYERNKPWYSKLGNLLNEEETWVFTLNHDLYLECLAIDLGVPVTYGDVERIAFPLSNLEPKNKVQLTSCKRNAFDKSSAGWFSGKTGVNLVRLHGGLAELEYRDGTILCNPSLAFSTSVDLIEEFGRVERMGYYHEGRRVPSGRTKVITGPDGTLDVVSRSMLTGGRKYSRTMNEKQGEEKLKLLDDVLLELDELTIVGYSFGDPHVNYRISNAMVRKPNLRIRIVNPAPDWRPTFLEQFDYDSRVRGALCRAGEWMTYADGGRWDAVQTEALKSSEGARHEVRQMVEAQLPGSADAGKRASDH